MVNNKEIDARWHSYNYVDRQTVVMWNTWKSSITWQKYETGKGDGERERERIKDQIESMVKESVYWEHATN
jgi:hypothetical protein